MGKGKKGNGATTPFRRVEGDIDVDPRLVDNSFEAKVSLSLLSRYFITLTVTHTHTQTGWS